jgi:RNA polymerase sigma-70 factor (ECF subfamily)
MLTEREFIDHWSAAGEALRSYALWLCRDRTQADDLVQQTALQAWAARRHLAYPGKVKSWFLVILRNCHYDALKRRRYEVEDPQGTYALSVATAPACEVEIEAEEVTASVQHLPDSLREPLTLVVFDGLSYTEASAVCSCKEGTIKSRIARARERLVHDLDCRERKSRERRRRARGARSLIAGSHAHTPVRA